MYAGVEFASEATILELVAERDRLRQEKKYRDGDKVREHLRSLGVEINDKERIWKSYDGRSGTLFVKGSGATAISDHEIQDYIAQREEARAEKDWARADQLRDELRGYGVECDDKSRTFRTSQGRVGTYVASVSGTDNVQNMSEDQIKFMVAAREKARAAQDFQAADEQRRQLQKLGIEVFDQERMWKSSDGRQGTIMTAGREIDRCFLSDSEIESRVKVREKARAMKDWQKADELRDELRALGVECADPERVWRTADGRQGSYGPLYGEEREAKGSKGKGKGGGGKGQWQATEQWQDPMQWAQQTMAKWMQKQMAQQTSGTGDTGVWAAQPGHNSWADSGSVSSTGKGFDPWSVKQEEPWLNSVKHEPQSQPQSALGPEADSTKLSKAAIEALVAGREEARTMRDFSGADAIRQDLRDHGVELLDEQRIWKSSDGQGGLIHAVTAMPSAARSRSPTGRAAAANAFRGGFR